MTARPLPIVVNVHATSAYAPRFELERQSAGTLMLRVDTDDRRDVYGPQALVFLDDATRADLLAALQTDVDGPPDVDELQRWVTEAAADLWAVNAARNLAEERGEFTAETVRRLDRMVGEARWRWTRALADLNAAAAAELKGE